VYKERCEKYELKAAEIEAKQAVMRELEEKLQRREALL